MSVESRAFAALKWATAAKLVVQIVSWVGTLVVVRLLTPADFGLMAKVAVVCTIAGAVAELGLGAAIVRWVELSREDLQKICGVSLLFGAAMTAILVAAAPLFAQLFQDPRLTWPIAVASLQIMIAAVAIVPSALWERDLSLKSLSKIEMAAGIASMIVTLLLALLGFGVWALVLSTLVAKTIRSAALLVLGDSVWPRFSFSGIGEHLKFGLTLVGSRVSYVGVVQSDVMIGSAFLPTTAIGHYSVAKQLSTLPMTKVMGTINRIMLPAIARQQDEPEQVRQSFLKSIRVISVVAFPTLWGISAVAPEFVSIILGPKWLTMVPALAILPIVVPIRMVFGVMFTTSLARGNRKLDLRATIFQSILIPLGFYVGAHWGFLGLCSAWLVSIPLAYAFSVPPVLRFLGVGARQFAAECGAPAVAAATMYLAVWLLRPALSELASLVTFGTLIVTGAVVYIAAIALISRRHLATTRNFARSLLGKGATQTA